MTTVQNMKSWLTTSFGGTIASAVLLSIIGSGVGFYTAYIHLNDDITQMHNKINRMEHRDDYLQRVVGRLVVQCLNRKERARYMTLDPPRRK